MPKVIFGTLLSIECLTERAFRLILRCRVLTGAIVRAKRYAVGPKVFVISRAFPSELFENPENDPFGVEIYSQTTQIYQTEVPEWPSLQSSRSGETSAKCCAAALPVHLLLALKRLILRSKVCTYSMWRQI
jgi:hypothetical protein